MTVEVGKQYRHTKTGKVYTVEQMIDRVKVSGKWINTWVIYRDPYSSGMIFGRQLADFKAAFLAV